MDSNLNLPWLPPRQHDPPTSPSASSRGPKARIVRVLSRADVDARAVPHSPLRTEYKSTIISSNSPRPRFNVPSLHLEVLCEPSPLFRLYFYLFRMLVFAHIPLQLFLDFNVVYMIMQISKHPSSSPSGRSWSLAAAAYIASAACNIILVFVLYELVYLFIRRWRIKRPRIFALYVSSAAFNFIAVQSYDYFCFMQTLRWAAFGFGLDRLRGACGDMRDGLAESCYFYSHNLPNVVLLLPRGGISVLLLLNYSSGRMDGVVRGRDATFFSANGSLSGYSQGILFLNAAWIAWRAVVLIASWFGLWLLSERGCAGICGPRYRWEDDEYEAAGRNSTGSDDSNFINQLPWDWKQCTRKRVQVVFEVCLVVPKRLKEIKRSAVPSSLIARATPYDEEDVCEDVDIEKRPKVVFSLNDSDDKLTSPPADPSVHSKKLASSTSSETLSSLGRPLSGSEILQFADSHKHKSSSSSNLAQSLHAPTKSTSTTSSGPNIPQTTTTTTTTSARSRSGSVPFPPGSSSSPRSSRIIGRPRARTRVDSTTLAELMDSPRSSSDSSENIDTEGTSLLHRRSRPPSTSPRPFSAAALIAAARNSTASSEHTRSYSSDASSVRSRLQSMRSRAQSMISRQSSIMMLGEGVDVASLNDESEKVEPGATGGTENHTFGKRISWLDPEKQTPNVE